MKELSQTMLAYMAGIIDGEGCITLAKQIRKDRPSPTYKPSVTVSNTDRRVIDLFIDNIGGVIYKRPERRMSKMWADSWTWYCKESLVIDFLEAILPYLLLKKEQAEILIEFQKSKRVFKRKSLGQGKGSSPLSQEEIDAKDAIWDAIRSLNKKGQHSRNQTTENVNSIL